MSLLCDTVQTMSFYTVSRNFTNCAVSSAHGKLAHIHDDGNIQNGPCIFHFSMKVTYLRKTRKCFTQKLQLNGVGCGATRSNTLSYFTCAFTQKLICLTRNNNMQCLKTKVISASIWKMTENNFYYYKIKMKQTEMLHALHGVYGLIRLSITLLMDF